MRVGKSVSIRVLTKNIRYATASPSRGEEPWDIRLPKVVDELRYSTLHCEASFICLQEALYKQVADILCELNATDNWDYIGVGRDDGNRAGEFSPILYRPSVFKLIEFANVWLSETPDKPSRGWDAACTRILTVGIFSHQSSKHQILALNTHLDHKGSLARRESARIILQEYKKYAMRQGGRELPTFLTGDFNSEPDHEAYLAITDDDSPMRDLWSMIPAKQRYGDINTFSGFTPSTRRKRIDFLFLNQKNSNDPTWRADGYAVLPNRFEDGVYNSDHQVVVGDMLLL